jgi:hypothetical protein
MPSARLALRMLSGTVVILATLTVGLPPEATIEMAAGRPLAKPGPFPFRRTHRPSGTTAGVGAEVIGVPGANGRGGPPITIPAGSFSTNLGLHGPEINIRAITAITTKAAIIGQLILLISTSPPLNRHSNRPRRARFLLLLPQCFSHCIPCANQSALRQPIGAGEF